MFRIDIFAIYIMLINIDVASIWLIINELDDRSEFEQYEYQIIEILIKLFNEYNIVLIYINYNTI